MPAGENISSGGAWREDERVSPQQVHHPPLSCGSLFLTTCTTVTQFQFLVHVIADLEEGGKKVDLKKIAPKMKGRTVKALSHMMTKIRQDANNADDIDDESPATVKKTTKRGRGGAKTVTSGTVTNGFA